MKKLLAFTLSVLMLVSIIPFGASAIEVEQVTGSSNAHDVLKAAIEKGINGLSGTAWSVEGGSSVSEMKSISAAAVDSFKVRKNTDVWHDFEPQSSPDAYAYSYDSNNKSYLLSIAAYEQSESFELKDGYGGEIPQSGILIRHSDLWTNKYLALTYTAEKDGKIQIYDPTGAEITAVSAVNDISNTGVFDVGAGSDGVYSKRGTLTVYKNGTVLWTKKLNANSRHFAWPEELKNIQVNAGDKISIVTGDLSAMPGALLAMNPQIDYIETAEKPDSAYLCLSEALRSDKNAGSTEAIENSRWQVALGSGESELLPAALGAPASPFRVLNYGDWKTYTPYSSVYGYSNANGAHGILPYSLEADGIELKDYTGAVTAPPKGVLINTDRASVRLTYVALEGGKMHLYDADGGNISVVQRIGTANTCSVRTVKAEILLNDVSVWDNNGTVFTAAAFPDLELYVQGGDTVEIIIERVESGADMCVALNPTADYSEKEEEPLPEDSNAHDVLKAAIEKGTNGLGGTAWSVEGGADVSSLNSLTPVAVDTFKVRDSGGWNDCTIENSPKAYVYYKNGNNYNENIAAYEQSDSFKLTDTYGGNIPASGIIIRHSDVWINKHFALTYTAEADGRIRLYDPTGADITAVSLVNGINTGTLDMGAVDGVYPKSGTLTVYKNDTVLWTKELNANSRHFAWPEVLQNITVNAGDKIRIVTKITKEASFGLVLAMNPQISYKEREIGDITDDGNIDILDMIKLKKLISDQKYDIYADLDGDRSLNTTDLAVMRKYLLGIIDEFPVNQVKKKITSLKTTAEKTYMVRGEEALPFYGVYIRADQIAAGSLETYFAKAAELGFQTVIVPIKWWWIENEMDVFDFSRVNAIYSYLEKYDLDVQLLWYGSDNCGYYYDNVPAYVRNNTAYYPLITRNGAKALDYSNDLLVAREARAVAALMNHIADIDTNRRLVSIQLENEANSCLPGSGDSITSTTAAADAEAMHFVGGQKKAILNLVNQLGLAVKASRYPCVTRFGFASYSCYNKGSAASLDTASEVLALDGIDAVGTNGFEPNTAMDTVFLKSNVGQSGNLPHIAEAPAGYASIFKKVLNAFSLGGGMLLYQLNETGINGGSKNKALSIYDTSADFTERDGTDSFVWNVDQKTYYYAATSDWKAFNGMIKAVGSRIADTATESTLKIIDAMDADLSGSITLGEKSFGCNMTGKPGNSYGTVGFIMRNSDGSYLLYSLKGGASFTLPEGAAATSGRYVNGEWAADGDAVITNSVLAVTEEAAASGTVYRVTF